MWLVSPAPVVLELVVRLCAGSALVSWRGDAGYRPGTETAVVEVDPRGWRGWPSTRSPQAGSADAPLQSRADLLPVWRRGHLVSWASQRAVLTAAITATNVDDSTLFGAVLEDVPPICTPSGRRRTRPAKVDGDKGYDSAANRAWLRRRGMTPRIARRGGQSSARVGRHRGGSSGVVVAELLAPVGGAMGPHSGPWFAFVLLAVQSSASTGPNQPKGCT